MLRRAVVSRNRAWGLLPRKTTFTLSPSSRTFSAEEGAANPATQGVVIVPASAALGIGVVTADAPSEAWLTVTPQGSEAAGWTLVVAVNNTGLVADEYTATCVIRASNADVTRTLTVTHTVTVAPVDPAVIQPGFSTFDFRGTSGVAATQPASDTCTVTNTGGTPFAGLEVSTAAPYLTAAIVNGKVQVTPNASTLPPGRTETIVTTHDDAADVDVDIGVLIDVDSPAPSPSIVVTPGSIPIAGVAGDGTTHTGTANVGNSGGGTLTQPSVSAPTYGAGWSSGLVVSISGSVAPYTLSAVATTGALTAATYSASVIVSGGGASNQVVVPISFIVASAPAPGGFPVVPFALPNTATHSTSTDAISYDPFSAPADPSGFA